MILPTVSPRDEYWYQTRASASPWHFRHWSVSRLYIGILHPEERVESSNAGRLEFKLHQRNSFGGLPRREAYNFNRCALSSQLKCEMADTGSFSPGTANAAWEILDCVVAAEVPDGTGTIAALWDLLAPQRLTEVVDVGANPIDSQPPYTPMLAAGLCRVTGFEPQEEALRTLQEKQGLQERYLPYVVGDGDAHTLNVCHGSGMTSLLEPDPAALDVFEYLKLPGEVVERVPVQARKLDDISEIHHVDFLKIDVQGSELAVFRGGTARLTETVAIQTEIAFVTLYKDQPTLGDIDAELRGQGFLPHGFREIKLWPISPCVDPRQPVNQLLEADIVYVRDFTHMESMSDEQLKHLALVAHHCYRSVDLALRCVLVLEQRQAVETGARQRYRDILAAG